MRYTLTGLEPTESDPVIPSGTTLAITASQVLKVKAWKPWTAPSETAVAAYTLKVLTPTVSPGTAIYSAPVTVTMTASTAGATIRYTTTGAEPTETSTAYTGSVVIGDTTTLKVAAFKAGWAASDTRTEVYTMNFGTLAPPTFSPPPGEYVGGILVTMSALAGATVRYTTDDTPVTPASPIAPASGLVINVDTTLRARAYHPNYTESPEASGLYTFTPDTTVPTITATVSPQAANGWHRAPVSVTFTCADADSPITFCGPPRSLSIDGAGLTVVGTAVDAAGNRATATVVVNLDQQPPSVTAFAPRVGDIFPPGTTTVTVRGNATDHGSGVEAEAVTCNTTPATLSGQQYACPVAVTDGTNAVVVQARDRAGHTSSRSLTIEVGNAPPPTALTISPTTLVMFAGETRTLRVTDQRGAVVTGGTWTSDNTVVVEPTTVEEEPAVHALAAGNATVTLTRNGLTAELSITVFAAGAMLPEGTTLWSIANPPGVGAPKRGQVLPATAMPDLPAGVDPPALFFVDEGLEYAVGGYTRFYRPYESPTRIRAVTADGRSLWEYVFNTQELMQVAADQFGGVVLVVKAGHDDNDAPLAAAVRRLDGLTGAVTWEYLAELEYGELSEVAIRADGMVFFTDIDGHSTKRTLVGIEGASGSTHTWPLTGGRYTRSYNEVVMEDHDTAPETTGPIVWEEGSIVLVAKRASTVQVTPGEWNAEGVFTATGPAETPLKERDFELITLADDPAAAPTAAPLNASVLSEQERDTWTPAWHRLMPDGQGGYLLTGGVTVNLALTTADPRVTTAIRRIDPNLALSQIVFPLTHSRTVYQADFVLGEDGAWASFEHYGDLQYCTEAVRFDPATLGVMSDTVIACTLQPQYQQLRYALAGGGIYVSGPASAVGNSTQVAPKVWVGWDGTASMKTGADAPIGASAWPYQRGSAHNYGAADTFTSNFNAMEIVTNVPSELIFNNYLRTFQGVNAGTIATVAVPGGAVSNVGDQLTFTLRNRLYQWGQGPFSVEVVRYDSSAFTIAARTLPGHPLLGWRYWRVFQRATDRVVVETGAFDKPAYGAFNSAFSKLKFWWAKDDQTEIWRQDFDYIRTQLGASQPMQAPYDQAIFAGQWDWDKVYIMTHVCGHAPAPSGFCQ